jgi:hypothetical protein
VPAPIRWAQRKDRAFVTIGVIDVRDPVLRIEFPIFTFIGTFGETASGSKRRTSTTRS